MRYFFTLFFLAILLLPQDIFANYDFIKFRQWTRMDGLWDSFSTNVTVGASGRVIVNHARVSHFSIIDGLQVSHKPKPPFYGPLSYNQIIENPTNEFWTLYYDTQKQIGGISHLENNTWIEQPLDFITLPKSQSRCFYPIQSHTVLLAEQANLWRISFNPINQTALSFSSDPEIGDYQSIQSMQNNQLCLIGELGFIIFTIPDKQQETIEILSKHLWHNQNEGWHIADLHIQDTTFGVGLCKNTTTNQAKIFIYEEGNFITIDENAENVLYAWPGPNRTIWEYHTNRMVYMRPHINQPKTLVDRLGVLEGSINNFYIHNQTFWAATNYGVIESDINLWQLPIGNTIGGDPPSAICETSPNQLWIAYGESFATLGKDESRKPYPPPKRSSKVYKPYPLKNQNIILDTYNYYPDILIYSIPDEEFLILSHPNGKTIFGCDRFDHETVAVFTGNPDTGKDTIELYDGISWQYFAPLPPEFASVDIRDALLDQQGNLWLATWGNEGLYKYSNNQWESAQYNPALQDKAILSLLELNNGNILAGGRNNLYQYDGKEWHILLKDIENIRSIALGNGDTIWLGTQNGIYYRKQNSWIHYTIYDGLPSNHVKQIFIASDGTPWACTQRGMVYFDQHSDQSPPETFIQYNNTASASIQNETAVIQFSGKDLWKSTWDHRLAFSYRLNQSEWTPFENDNRAAFTGLPVGQHQFEVRSMDLAGNIDPTPAKYTFNVMPIPLQQKPWFTIAVAAIFSILFLLTLSTIIAWRRVARHADEMETQVALRTQDLQKAYLQLKEDSEHRKQLEDQLRQTSKLEAIGTLAGGIAHDFNNVLTGIMGFAYLIKESPENRPFVVDSAEKIIESSQKVANITKQILAFSRKQTLKPVDVNVNDIVEKIHPLLTNLINKSIDIQTRMQPTLGWISIDPTQLEQVIINLTVNARDAMPNGGILIIETQNVFLDEHYAKEHPEAIPGNYIMLSVTDNGCGIPSDVIEHIFDPFYTTKKMGEGTGMGLSTVHGIVKQSGGSIYVYSEIMRGTTFKLYFPRIDTPTPNDNDTENEQQFDGQAIQCKVLLVEDEERIRVFTSEALKDFGCKVMVAENGVKALELIQQMDYEFDLLITDLIMPKLGGYELYQRLLTIKPDLHVLFISGYAFQTMEINGALPQHFELLQKPFMPNELKAAMIRVLKTPNDDHLLTK